jgi:hypothetical protein
VIGRVPILNRLTDVDIPNEVWSPWRESGKPRTLRRPLTNLERDALQIRVAQLSPMVEPFGKGELDLVALAIADMFGSFRSMRQTDGEVIATVDATARAVAEFPCWAIEKACRWIQSNGVWRDGKFDRQWPPSDAELIDEVRKQRRLYGDQYDSAVALLAAPVERDEEENR